MRLIGAIEAKQRERDGTTQRNDRLVAVFAKSRGLRGVKRLSDLEKNVLEELEHFVVSFNEAKGKQFKVTGRSSPIKALKLVNTGMLSHRRRSK